MGHLARHLPLHTNMAGLRRGHDHLGIIFANEVRIENGSLPIEALSNNKASIRMP